MVMGLADAHTPHSSTRFVWQEAVDLDRPLDHLDQFGHAVEDVMVAISRYM